MTSLLAFSVALASARSMAGASISIEAVVLKVDRTHRRATIRYAALDTAPGGVRVVGVRDPATLHRMWAGESIAAVADTSHTPWTLSRVIETLR